MQRRDSWARLARTSRGLWGLAVKATEVCRQAKFGRMRTQAEELARQIEKGDPPRPWLPIVNGEAQKGAVAARDVDEDVALQVVRGLARRRQES